MKKIASILFVLALLSLAPLLAEEYPEGRTVKVTILDQAGNEKETLKGELLSVTPDLIVLNIKNEKDDKPVVLGCPVANTEVVSLKKVCGPIVAIFQKSKKFDFDKNDPAKNNENLAKLSYYALYGTFIPDDVRQQMTLYGQN